MNRSAIILYGPPAAGKDTITQALSAIDLRYQLFRRLKHGPGRTAGYRLATVPELDALRNIPGEILWENSRYGSTYIVDRSYLNELTSSGIVPILHLGQADAVIAVTSALPSTQWLVVELWCPRTVALDRIEGRKTGDTAERLAAFDATMRLSQADLRIDTSTTPPSVAAKRILAARPEGHDIQ